ncbi:MAG: DUF5018 domain-containing protein [Dysgonamonadaceae bacterium]|nr:DUF5018 domain-containing protein [Dysgonamonadaceae bacterium]
MKKAVYLWITFLFFVGTGCTESVDIAIPDNYEVANITGMSIYDTNVKAIASKATIDNEAKTVTATLTAAQDITKLKVTLTISPGATVTSPLGTGFLDFSQPKTITIVSPGQKVTHVWTIAVVNP